LPRCSGVISASRATLIMMRMWPVWRKPFLVPARVIHLFTMWRSPRGIGGGFVN